MENLKINKVIEQIKKLNFTIKKEIIPIQDSDLKAYMDIANIYMIIPKTKEMEGILNLFDIKPVDVPKFDYLKTNGEVNTSKYSIEYLKSLIDLMSLVSESSIKLSLKKDFPLTIENDVIKIILAPRVLNS